MNINPIKVLGMVALIGVGGVVVYNANQTPLIAENPNTEEVVSETPQPEWMTDEDAIKAAQDVIRRKELEARDAELTEQINALKAEQAEVQKELSF